VKKGSLGIISFNLFAESVNPILKIDRKARADGEIHMNYKYWSYRGGPDNEAPSAI